MANHGADTQQDPPLPPKPEPPHPDECCKSGCVPCVHELYEDALDRWEARVAEIQAKHGKAVERR